MRIQVPDITDKDRLFKFLRENKQLHISAKKSEMKCADGVFSAGAESDKVFDFAKKSIGEQSEGKTSEIIVKAAINTTNLLDSHMDVHIPGIWNKSIKDKKIRYLLQEHKLEFDKIIADSNSDNLKASVAKMLWPELGYKQLQGDTEVLVYEALVKQSRNADMFNNYIKGYVLNHSVGMQYVKIYLAMNSENKYDIEEKDNWDKYITMVANKAEAEAYGYFWAVTEAREIEGSAVPLGSNWATPTMSVTEPSNDTPKAIIEPPQGTQLNYESLKSLLINI